MNIQEFHAAVVSLCPKVSGDAANQLSAEDCQLIRDEVASLRQQTDLLFELARDYRHSGVRRVFEDDAGNEYQLGNFDEDASGRLEGQYLSTHELALGRILDRLNGEEWWLEDDMLHDLRTEAAFADGQRLGQSTAEAIIERQLPLITLGTNSSTVEFRGVKFSHVPLEIGEAMQKLLDAKGATIGLGNGRPLRKAGDLLSVGSKPVPQPLLYLAI